MSRIVIVGATSAIAHQCAILWAGRPGTELILVGRDKDRLTSVRHDLLVRSPQALITCREVDFLNSVAIDRAMKEIALEAPIDKALIAHGFMPDQSASQLSPELLKETLEITGVSPLLFAQSLANLFIAANHGTLGVISSVADVRGRRKNYIYGSAKAMISHFVAGLSHRLYGTNVRIVSIKPGPTATPMTAHLPARGLAKAAKVAKGITAALDGNSRVVYLPKIWRVITLIIGLLPQPLFNRLNL